jgi:hypothetical protein
MTSSYCTLGNCVSVSSADGGHGVVMSDTKDRSREPLTFSDEEWALFVAGVKAGEFDPPS